MIMTAEEFARLRRSADPAEYGRAATEEAPLSVWLETVERFPELRDWVAHNKTVPHEVLEKLAVDQSASVRHTVARKRKLRLELQKLLAHDADASVRAGLAHNAKCDVEVLKMLAQDKAQFVRDAARKRLEERGNAL